MPRPAIHRFEHGGKRFAMDPETCFCFECDEICWDVLEHYPHETGNRILNLLEATYSRKELEEVAGELEWLRATKSILKAPKKEELLKLFEVDRGLKRVSVALPREGTERVRQARWFKKPVRVMSATAGETGRAAVTLLLARSGAQKDLHLEFVEPGHVHNPELIAGLCEWALKTAGLAGKNTTASVRVTGIRPAKLPEPLAEHMLSARLELHTAEGVLGHVRALAAAVEQPLARLAKALQPEAQGVGGRIIVTPNNPRFGQVAQALDKAGFTGIEIDLDGAYAANPGLDPAAMNPAMEENARYYAGRLLKHHYFRLDPIAPLFWRIYSGAPMPRNDPAGTNELAVDEDGKIYPCAQLTGVDGFCLGKLADGKLDEDKIRLFEDVGSLTTAPCIACWARNLCGGGAAAVHHALTGSFRTPQPAWCEAQRGWMESAVSAFQMLSSAGIHFERVYKILGRRERPSLFSMAKAALTMNIAARPIEEADAELLTQWENWNESAYFLFCESGIYLATKYDREMESLHPRGIDQELILLRKSGEPFGLLKLRPKWVSGAVLVWLYMRDEKDCAEESIRKSFRAILKQAAGQEAIKQIVVPVSHAEAPLAQFLQAVGFTRLGVMRDALYLHGGYKDVTLYAIAPHEL